jgi:adenine-specific DNA-methyltransferase
MVGLHMQEIYQAYYTKSHPLVHYMMNMLSVEPGMRVLEPCAGDGVFIDALQRKMPDIILDAYELNPEAVSLLKEKYGRNSNVCIKHADTLVDDDLTCYANLGGFYDRIIANPPYGAWQDYEKRKDLKRLYPDTYVKETYTLFLLRGIRLLADHGRLVFVIPDTFLNLHMHTALREYLLTHTRIQEIALFPSSFFPNVNFGYANLSIITLERSHSRDECLDHQFSVVTGFRSVEELGTTGKRHLKTYTFIQREVYQHAHHSFFVSDNPVVAHLKLSKQSIGDIADCVTGFYSGNDQQYLRPVSLAVKNSKRYKPLETHLICHDYMTKAHLLDGLDASECYIPIVKGGATRYFKPDIWYIDWSTEAVRTYKTDKKARFQNANYYFRYGIGIPMVSSSQVTAALIEHKLFDQSIVGIFPHDPRWLYYLLAFFNSPTCNTLLRTINPSANNSANYIKKIPFIEPAAEIVAEIDRLIQEILAAVRAGRCYERESEVAIHECIRRVYGF